MSSSAASSSASGNPAMGDSSSPPPGGAIANSTPTPLIPLYVFMQLPDKPELAVKGTLDPNGTETYPWTASITFTHAGQAQTLSATDPAKQKAKTKVAEQYLDIVKPDWRVPVQAKLVSVTERTADQILYEIEQVGDCKIVHPHLDDAGEFFVGSVDYKMHHFEERVPVEKHESACKKQVALKLLQKLAIAQHPHAVEHMQILKPNFFIRGRLMPMEENAEAEFKGHGLQTSCLTPDHAFFTDEKLVMKTLRTICALLNSDGGSMWFGVHDSGLIQGMLMDRDERDKLELSLRTRISTKLEPVSWDYVHFRWHEVASDPTLPDPVASLHQSLVLASAPVSGKPPGVFAGSTQQPAKSKSVPNPPRPPRSHINAAPVSVQQRLNFLEKLLNPAVLQKELSVLQICVLPSRVVHFWGTEALYRNGNQTVTLPIPMLKAKIREEPV